MKNKAFTLVELLVVIAIIAILAGMIIPSWKHAKAASAVRKQVEQPEKVILSETKMDYSTGIRTVLHDGHWFILATHGDGTSIINHPACPKCPTMKWIAP